MFLEKLKWPPKRYMQLLRITVSKKIYIGVVPLILTKYFKV